MNLTQNIHSSLIFPRRSKIIANILIELLPKNSRVLDIGCGDGTIDTLIIKKRPDIKITGVDILKREKTVFPVVVYDGKNLPFPTKSFNCSIFIDTLHHEKNIESLIEESRRVTRNNIIIKDHYADRPFSYAILKIMDWVGNKSYNVNLPYNYYSRKQWQEIYDNFQLSKEIEINNLGLYPFPFSLIFERGIHFITKLKL